MSRAEEKTALEARQLHRLNALIAEISASNAFYAPRLLQAGLEKGVASLAEFREKMGFTTKADLIADQQEYPPYGTNLTYPLDRYIRFHQTSGTSGSPIRWLDTQESWGWMVDNWVEVLKYSGVTPQDRIFFAFSFGPFLGFWTAFEAGLRYGCLCLPGGGLSTAGRLKTLLDNAVTVLCCTPTYALRLGEMAQEEGVDLTQSALRLIVVAGEPGANIPATRRRIEELWGGAQVRDHHGMTEIGPVSYECPYDPSILHLLEESFIPEVLDTKTGLPTSVGEKGELILTNLGRTGSPLLRYRTGDLVQLATAPCGCGSLDMALRGGILGRVDDMFVVRGVNLHPSAVETVLHRFDQIAEYRVLLTTARAMSEIAIEIEPREGTGETLAQEVETTLRAVFNLRIPVTAVPQGSLPRFEMKARRWVRTQGKD